MSGVRAIGSRVSTHDVSEDLFRGIRFSGPKATRVSMGPLCKAGNFAELCPLELDGALEPTGLVLRREV